MNMILHMDADAFFASVEQARDPRLKGCPVVVGAERGIATAFSYEAKDIGVRRGMPIYQIKRQFPQVVIKNGDYNLYEKFSRRMFGIVGRYIDRVEEYSTDECFGDIKENECEKIMRTIQSDISRELDIPVSLGASLTKTLAKVASKWDKPRGVIIIPQGQIYEFLARLPVENVWGIGRATGKLLNSYDIHTGFDFVTKDEAWVKARLRKPGLETWRELRGERVFMLDTRYKTAYQSMSDTRTFSPPSSSPTFLFTELARHTEAVCAKARRSGQKAERAQIFLKTQQFSYATAEVKFACATNSPEPILSAIEPMLRSLIKPGIKYRATGVTLTHLTSSTEAQTDIFDAYLKTDKLGKLHQAIDIIDHRFGKNTIHLAASLRRLPKTKLSHQSEYHLRKYSASKDFNLPVLGEIS